MTRSVLFDTETTGLEPDLGHRVIEIAALELINDLPTGKHYHALIDPEREVPDDVVRVHGLTSAQLAGKPRFADIAEAMLTFFARGPLIAHNAPFDFGFLDAELDRLGLPRLEPARMIDTLVLAKNRFPGMPNSLDALCRRFGIDLSERTTHNALLDCRLLADVYVELTGGRQRGLSLAAQTIVAPSAVYRKNGSRMPRPITPSVEERAAHAAMIARLTDPVWFQLEPDGGSEGGMLGTRAESG
jgi:DNA polymerase-3 subunit epsilon